MSQRSYPYLALLRGINVGGNNIISKDDLRGCFESLGFENVKTYIQSGNILFRATSKAVTVLTKQIESTLSTAFKYDALAVVYSRAEYIKAVESAPKNWGHDDQMKHNAMFIMDKTKSKDLLKELPEPKPGMEHVSAGHRVVFWSAQKKNLVRTNMMKVGAMPAYKRMTVRNHNTTFKLLKMFNDI